MAVYGRATLYARRRRVAVLLMFIITCLMFSICDTSHVTGKLSKAFFSLANTLLPFSSNYNGVHDAQYPSRKDGEHVVSGEKSAAPSHASHSSLIDDRVFLAMKTGYSMLYKRVPLHLTTTLSTWPPEKLAIYSDLPDKIGHYSIIDVFENITKPPALFSQYNTLREIQINKDYLKSRVYRFMDNTDGSKDGWALDRFKFLPMIDHAQKNWPNMDWYVFMEEDGFLFIDNVVKYLRTLNADDAQYLGRVGQMHGGTFAHGGSGYVLSRGAIDATFRKNSKLVEEYEEMTQSHRWGDEILGKVLADYGILLNGDRGWRWGWEAEPHWNTDFISGSVCAPLFSFHHLQPHEIADYWEFNVAFTSSSKGPMRYLDFFIHYIRPYISQPVEYWDNLSGEHVITSTHNSTVTPNSDAWQSTEGCAEACKAREDCLQWLFREDHCGLETKIMLGKTTQIIGEDPAWLRPSTSGWILERIDKIWNEASC